MQPLPLTPFEELMLWEDRPAYPMTVFIRTRFEGRLNRQSWEAAVRRTVQLHPLLQCIVELRRGRPWWVPSSRLPTTVWRHTADDLDGEFPSLSGINLFDDVGLRFDVVVGDTETDVFLQFHHACCDGGGFRDFVNDLFVAYALERGENAAGLRLPEYDLSRLPERNRFGLTWGRILTLIPDQLIGLKGARQFLARQPAQVAEHRVRENHEAPPAAFPAAARHVFTPDETHHLRMTARRREVTVNELLTLNLFLAIMYWRQQYGHGHDQEWIRMMVPWNLRSHQDRRLSAANVVSSVFLDRKGEDAAHPDKLLASIHDELQLIRRKHLGLTFQFSLKVCSKLPGGIRRSVNSSNNAISCVFTNMGKMASSVLPKCDGRAVLGDARLEYFQALVPIRRNSCLSFCAHQYARQLAVDLHYDPAALNQSQADHLMTMFEELTTESLAFA